MRATAFLAGESLMALPRPKLLRVQGFKGFYAFRFRALWFRALPIVSIVAPFLVNQKLYYRILTIKLVNQKRNYKGDSS